MEPCANSTPGFKRQRRKLSGSDILKCRCQNCAATTHKTWECPEGKNITPDIVCEHCGNAGHPTFDCKVGSLLSKCCIAMVQVLQRCNGASDAMAQVLHCNGASIGMQCNVAMVQVGKDEAGSEGAAKAANPQAAMMDQE